MDLGTAERNRWLDAFHANTGYIPICPGGIKVVKHKGNNVSKHHHKEGIKSSPFPPFPFEAEEGVY